MKTIIISILVAALSVFITVKAFEYKANAQQLLVKKELKCAWSAGKARIPLSMINKGTYCSFFANESETTYGMAY